MKLRWSAWGLAILLLLAFGGSVAQSIPKDDFTISVTTLKDVAYGSDIKQRFDVYLPNNLKPNQLAPVIFMVHGGAWKSGDKTYKNIVRNKVQYWLPKGYIFVSVNYRLFPKAKPEEQVNDIAKALAKAQRDAPNWGGDSNQFILMGHSAGAHLITLLAISPKIIQQADIKPFLGTVSLDSAALDVEWLMQSKYSKFFADVFTHNPNYWPSVSPFHTLKTPGKPLLMVCAIKRGFSCPLAKRFVEKAQTLGNEVYLIEEDLTHAEVNANLGLPNQYTEQVNNFIQHLLPTSPR